jgi:hypothetical protein
MESWMEDYWIDSMTWPILVFSHCLSTWSIEQYTINIKFTWKIQSYIHHKRFDNASPMY